jgi:NAD(P)H-hydrate repair Nnr-like enzyme with NAD(P)H-hydrate dehydratase domain
VSVIRQSAGSRCTTVLENWFVRNLPEADQVNIIRKIVDGVIQQTGAPALREMFELLPRANFATRKRWLDPEARMSPQELKVAVLDADALSLNTAREKAERARNRTLTAHDQLLYGVDTYKWLNLVDNRLNKVITHAEEILASLSVTGRGTESVIHERLREVGQRFIDTAEIMESLTGEAEARKAARARPEPEPEPEEILIITGVVV